MGNERILQCKNCGGMFKIADWVYEDLHALARSKGFDTLVFLDDIHKCCNNSNHHWFYAYSAHSISGLVSDGIKERMKK